MISVFRSGLLPGWVAEGVFPEADEDQLAGLQEQWTSLSTAASTTQTDVEQHTRALFSDNWTGGASQMASQQMNTVSQWAGTIATTGTDIAAGVGKAVSLITHTKTAQNGVLRALHIVITKLMKSALANPTQAPLLLMAIPSLQLLARAILEMYYSALTNALGGIAFTSTIQPSLATTTAAAGNGGKGTGGADAVNVNHTTTGAPGEAGAGGATGWTGSLTKGAPAGDVDAALGTADNDQARSTTAAKSPALPTNAATQLVDEKTRKDISNAVRADFRQEGFPISGDRHVPGREPAGTSPAGGMSPAGSFPQNFLESEFSGAPSGRMATDQPAGAPFNRVLTDTQLNTAGATQRFVPPLNPNNNQRASTGRNEPGAGSADGMGVPGRLVRSSAEKPGADPADIVTAQQTADTVTDQQSDTRSGTTALPSSAQPRSEAPAGTTTTPQSGTSSGPSVTPGQPETGNGTGAPESPVKDPSERSGSEAVPPGNPSPGGGDGTGLRSPESTPRYSAERSGSEPVVPGNQAPAPDPGNQTPPSPNTGRVSSSAPEQPRQGWQEQPAQGGHPGGSGGGSQSGSSEGRVTPGYSPSAPSQPVPPPVSGTGAAGAAPEVPVWSPPPVAPVAPGPVTGAPGFGALPAPGGSGFTGPGLSGPGFGGSMVPPMGLGGTGGFGPGVGTPGVGAGVVPPPVSSLGGSVPPASSLGGSVPAHPVAVQSGPGSTQPGPQSGSGSVPAVPASGSVPASGPVPAVPASGPVGGPGGGSVSVAPGARVDPLGVVAGLDGTWVITLPMAISILGLTGLAVAHFTRMWQELRADALQAPRATLFPTQWGRGDLPLVPMPAGMETPYQKVLLPGETEQLLEGRASTVQGLVYPLAQVRHLTTPQRLHDALGLGFALNSQAGSNTLAFNRGAESVEVLRFNGVRAADMITPTAPDVCLPRDTVPAPLTRRHSRPWTGRGEAPGSTTTHPIDEHEILSYATVAVPHLAEMWRVYADGREEYVSTFNQRNGQWVGQASACVPEVGRRIDNGVYATLVDGTAYHTVTLNTRQSVLVAYGLAAPEHFEKAFDGSHRLTVANTRITSLTGVATVGMWSGVPVRLLHRQGDNVKVDYAGDDPVVAGRVGFVQVNQAQWEPVWVPHAQVTGIHEIEHPYYPQPVSHHQATTPQ